MAEQQIEETPIERIRDRASIIGVLATQLEATARAMTHVSHHTEDGQQPIEPEDLPRIMHLFAQQLSSIVDVAGDIEATTEVLSHTPLTLVHD
jgi:hypothetical protein